MPKISSRRALVAGLSLACISASPTLAQETPVPAEQQASQAAAGGDAVDPCQAPKKKKKKGLGLGGLFKAARSSGLTNLAGMGGLGKGGALANAAIGTAAAIGENAATADAAKQAASGC